MQDGKIVMPKGGAGYPSIGPEKRKQIDRFLQERGLNEYGDAPGTMYMGGTPLFDERTGAETDRYVYLLRRFPELS
ncbi:MAG: hypothetical protein H3C47_09005 [Candidatus Cloacimonetes bacterium]|nr:hypothetical protein [Candidatus Cloacimonadota bacterium]